MIKMHELSAKPSNIHIMQEIEKLIWKNNSLGFKAANIPAQEIPKEVITMLKSDGYKEVRFDEKGANLFIQW